MSQTRPPGTPNLIWRGGSQIKIGTVPSAPGAKRSVTLPSGPGWTSALTNHEDNPGPVDTSSQTRSVGAVISIVLSSVRCMAVTLTATIGQCPSSRTPATPQLLQGLSQLAPLGCRERGRDQALRTTCLNARGIGFRVTLGDKRRGGRFLHTARERERYADEPDALRSADTCAAYIRDRAHRFLCERSPPHDRPSIPVMRTP